MTTSTSGQTAQPRGTSGHKPGAYSEKVPTPPPGDSELTGFGDIEAHYSSVLPGDIIYGDLGQEVGVATTVGAHPIRGGEIRILLAGKGAISADPTDTISIHRTAEAPVYVTTNEYDRRLAAIYHVAATEATLERAARYEAEDDFMFAIASHRNAGPLQIDKASRHNSFVVRQAAIDNPNTGIYTLRRLGSQASFERRWTETRIRSEGGDTVTGSLRGEIEQSQKIEDLAREALIMRGYY